MRRAAWIFFASIFLPSLGLAWLAIHSVRDQQVVLEHQQAIICQNITDTLAKNIQNQMDQVRGDFVKQTQQLLKDNGSPQILAQNFNRTLRDAWPLAEIGFAVNLDGEIFSPSPYDGPEARTFRDENDRFLSNRENVEVYSSNALVTNQSAALNQNAASQLALKLPFQAAPGLAEKAMKQSPATAELQAPSQIVDTLSTRSKDATPGGADFKATGSAVAGKVTPSDRGSAAAATESDTTTSQLEAKTTVAPALDESMAATDKIVPAAPAANAPASAAAAVPASGSQAGAEAETFPVPSTTVVSAPSSSSAGEQNELFDSSAKQRLAKIQRQVIPQQMLARDSASLSSTVPEESDFRRVIGVETSGELARFLENKMRLLVWFHAEPDAPLVFGAQLDLDKLVETLQSSLQIPDLARDSWDSFSRSRTSDSGFCAAILDDTGHPVALSRPGFVADWKHPFVSTEIGEVLPHWEAALYLVDPKEFSRAAQTLQVTFLLIVILLVTAIIAGGSAIGRDVRREMRLAQQKTDFVSNVSHELKTPLTSIRMFADLLAEKRVPDEERQATYLRIIAAEASRLTRLINNVLDFARLEKGAPHGEHAACDLVEAVRDVAGTCAPHLEAAGIAFQCEIEAEPLPIRGDRDALAQIILNLISNAEKYGGSDILVRVRRQETAAGALGCVDVLDRGAGIPARQVRTVFEPFQRLDDSLTSGIPGSGLGLTLARRMARAHGGDVTYSARAGGGSCFTLAVPLV